MKKLYNSCAFASALVATIFSPQLPVYGNEQAPYDPFVEVYQGGAPTSNSQVSHSADFQKEGCEIESLEAIDIPDAEGNFLRLYVLTQKNCDKAD